MREQQFSGLAGAGFDLLDVSADYFNSMTIPAQTIRTASEDLVNIFDGSPTKSGVSVNSRTVLGYPAVFRGVNLIANTVAKLPLYVRKIDNAGGSTVDREHFAYPLLKRNRRRSATGGWEPGRMPASTFRKTITGHAQIHGNGYAAIYRNNRGEPVELLVLDPPSTFPVKYIPDEGETEIWYITEIDGAPVKLRAEDVIHIRHLSIDGLIGLSVIDLMKEAFGLGMAAREFGARFFGEGSNASGVLMIPGHLKEGAQKNVLKMWNSMASGLARSHRVALVQDGVKFQQLTIPPEQAQFLETRRFELIEVANILGLPPHKLGDNSRTAYNSIEAENRAALEESYDPWLCAWEEECEAKLLTEQQLDQETHLIQFDRSGLLKTQFKDRVDGYRILREMGVYSVNDVLRKEGEPTIGDPGNLRHVPANWVTLSAEATPADDPGVLAHLRPVLADRLNHMAGIEAKILRSQIGKNPQIDDWEAKTYQAHALKLCESLRAIVKAIYDLTGVRGDEDAVLEIADSWCQQSRLELRELANRGENIDHLCSRFSVRVEETVNQIMESVKCRN